MIHKITIGTLGLLSITAGIMVKDAPWASCVLVPIMASPLLYIALNDLVTALREETGES